MEKKTLMYLILTLLIIMSVQNQRKTEMASDDMMQLIYQYKVGQRTLPQFVDDANVVISAPMGGGGDGDSYSSYFDNNPDVMSASLGTLSDQETVYFYDYIDELEENGSIVMPLPEDFTDERWIDLTKEEIERIHASRVAHSIYLDKNNIMPWSLNSYSMDELGELFQAPPNRFTIVVDHSISEIYTYTTPYVLSDMKDTAYNIMYNLRDFEHGETPQSRYDPMTVLYALTDLRESPTGCHSMSIIISSMLRSINIPATYEYGWYSRGTHGSMLVYGEVQKVLFHGDFMYNHTDTDYILMNMSWFDENIRPCGRYPDNDEDCTFDQTRRWVNYNEYYRGPEAEWRCCEGFVYRDGEKVIGCYHLINNDYYLTDEDKDYLLNYWINYCEGYE